MLIFVNVNPNSFVSDEKTHAALVSKSADLETRFADAKTEVQSLKATIANLEKELTNSLESKEYVACIIYTSYCVNSRAKRSFTYIDGSSWKKKRLTFRSLERSEKSLTAKLKETLDVLKQREEKHKRSDQELRDKLKVRAQCGRIANGVA